MRMAAALLNGEAMADLRRLVARALVDRATLHEHIRFLQRWMPALQQRSEPPADFVPHELDECEDACDSVGQQSPACEPTAPFADLAPLPEDRAAAVVQQGLAALDNAEVRSLALNPVAMYALFDAIEEEMPEAWFDEMDSFGGEIFAQLSQEAAPPAQDADPPKDPAAARAANRGRGQATATAEERCLGLGCGVLLAAAGGGDWAPRRTRVGFRRRKTGADRQEAERDRQQAIDKWQ